MKGLKVLMEELKDEKVKKSFIDKLKIKAMSLLEHN